MNLKAGIMSGQVHDVYNVAGDAAGSAVRCVRKTSLKTYISPKDIYVPYVDLAFSDRSLTAVSAIVTLDYFVKNFLNFTLPIYVFTDTLHHLQYLDLNDTRKAQIWTIVEGAEAAKYPCFLLWCSLHMVRKNLLQFLRERRSSRKTDRRPHYGRLIR